MRKVRDLPTGRPTIPVYLKCVVTSLGKEACFSQAADLILWSNSGSGGTRGDTAAPALRRERRTTPPQVSLGREKSALTPSLPLPLNSRHRAGQLDLPLEKARGGRGCQTQLLPVAMHPPTPQRSLQLQKGCPTLTTWEALVTESSMIQLFKVQDSRISHEKKPWCFRKSSCSKAAENEVRVAGSFGTRDSAATENRWMRPRISKPRGAPGCSVRSNSYSSRLRQFCSNI